MLSSWIGCDVVALVIVVGHIIWLFFVILCCVHSWISSISLFVDDDDMVSA